MGESMALNRLIKSEKGVTIIQAVITIALISLTTIIVVMGGALISFANTARTEDLMVVTEVLENEMEIITAMPISQIKANFPDGYTKLIYPLASRSGILVLNYISTSDPDLLGIKLTAFWNDQKGTQRHIELFTLKS